MDTNIFHSKPTNVNKGYVSIMKYKGLTPVDVEFLFVPEKEDVVTFSRYLESQSCFIDNIIIDDVIYPLSKLTFSLSWTELLNQNYEDPLP